MCVCVCVWERESLARRACIEDLLNSYVGQGCTQQSLTYKNQLLHMWLVPLVAVVMAGEKKRPDRELLQTDHGRKTSLQSLFNVASRFFSPLLTTLSELIQFVPTNPHRHTNHLRAASFQTDRLATKVPPPTHSPHSLLPLSFCSLSLSLSLSHSLFLPLPLSFSLPLPPPINSSLSL